MTEKKKKNTFKSLVTDYWALSRQRQEAFLKGLYQLSPENKNLFQLWLAKDNDAVAEDIKKNIDKETFKRVGKFKKLRLAKINEILRNAEKISLPMMDRIEIKNMVWRGMLAFILGRRGLPERYEVACARHLDQYLLLVRHHILETSEADDRLAEARNFLFTIIQTGKYLPYIEDVYLKNFSK